ncbi:hypothetical protein ABK040_011905 [Willaertia magna]
MSWYARLNSTYPIVTRSLTTGITSAACDGLVQLRMKKEGESYSFFRSLKMFCYGTFALGPILHHWFGFLERAIPLHKEMTKPQRFKTILKRIVLDQGVYAPSIITFFMTAQTALDYYLPDQRTSETIKNDSKTLPVTGVISNKLSRDFLPTYLTSCSVWPAAQMFNFYVIPPNFRVLFVGMVGLWWNCLLYFKQQKP